MGIGYCLFTLTLGAGWTVYALSDGRDFFNAVIAGSFATILSLLAILLASLLLLAILSPIGDLCAWLEEHHQRAR